ncbi:hypothetical protein A2303_06435 [Candidatus Falkowbacteria bacterium RIFOXYB2_FULL_47_14]|uniref:Type IV pilus modification protein PilV n=1 Tax=Candidatus Falkowbacteria bacterium RIFOXYA2_FULL_47_19 TaxID=1797994 RepID=A0A1F5SJ74_9BACT|nr:MAG: hypothetical protein A2227_06385 [Candidatus Falkowbacteria bacterium RIFOXYA2_FULL_47_19]OGF35716.1 MAG: hypothetical protein A2468_05060 [Candidatus Falkowbacteria bacterium RIFOXYC2_FULL_46_15]OGF43979.1 MAG: hypothetical protein A2303_06435 [Candidatus Falkowbacteria bacterium RIFOXYB2_FULL_47_14]
MISNDLVKNEKGMSIAEAVMAISVITIGLLGVSSLAIQNIQIKGVNRNYLIASMLAQEGIELTRNIRDQNWLNIQNDPSDPSLAWDDWITDGSVPPNAATFTIDHTNTSANPPDQTVDDIADAGALLYVNDTDNFYTHNPAGATASIFRRLVSVLDYGDYLVVTVAVGWPKGEYVVETYLYNWR